MSHSAAKAAFDAIRARPYGVPSAPDMHAENCYYKGLDLLQRLSALGYSVRECFGETYWDAQLLPKEIIALESPDFQVTHFWCEVMLDGAWVALDPSYDPPLAKYGFTVTEFGDGQLCFDITRRYTPEDVAQKKDMWVDPDYVRRYFAANEAFLKALNAFFISLR